MTTQPPTSTIERTGRHQKRPKPGSNKTGGIPDLVAEHRRLTAAIPPDVTGQLADLRHQRASLERDRADLRTGTGRWVDTSVGHAHQTLEAARRRHHHDLQRTQDPHLGLIARSRARRTEQASTVTATQANIAWHETIEPQTSKFARQHQQLEREARQLDTAREARAAFLDANPRIVARITELEEAIAHQERDAHPPAVHSRTATLRPRARNDQHLVHIHAQHAPTASSPRIHGPSI